MAQRCAPNGFSVALSSPGCLIAGDPAAYETRFADSPWSRPWPESTRTSPTVPRKPFLTHTAGIDSGLVFGVRWYDVLSFVRPLRLDLSIIGAWKLASASMPERAGYGGGYGAADWPGMAVVTSPPRVVRRRGRSAPRSVAMGGG